MRQLGVASRTAACTRAPAAQKTAAGHTPNKHQTTERPQAQSVGTVRLRQAKGQQQRPRLLAAYNAFTSGIKVLILGRIRVPCDLDDQAVVIKLEYVGA